MFFREKRKKKEFQAFKGQKGFLFLEFFLVLSVFVFFVLACFELNRKQKRELKKHQFSTQEFQEIKKF